MDPKHVIPEGDLVVLKGPACIEREEKLGCYVVLLLGIHVGPVPRSEGVINGRSSHT
jgi:hypothetical protein